MSAPKLTTLGVVLSVGDGCVFLTADEPPHEEALGVKATPEEQRAWSALLMTEGAVRITIEPADATPEEAPHGSPLDYLAEAKRMLESDHFAAYVDGCGREFQDSDGCKRLISLLNSAHLSALNYLRRQP